MNPNDRTCTFCQRIFSNKSNLKKHMSSCKKKEVQQQQNEVNRVKERYEILFDAQRDYYEAQLHILRNQLDEQKRLVQMYQEQIFEIAKQPRTTQRTNNYLNIIQQLAPYDLDPVDIHQLVEEHFTVDVFHGGPEEIAKLAAQVILTDPETQKPKIACTDVSRKIFRYMDAKQELQIDPGFQKTHNLIRNPLSQANIRVFHQHLGTTEQHREQWRKNEDFISDRLSFSDKLLLKLS